MTVCLLQGYAADFGILFSLPLTATFLEKIVYNSCLYLPTLLTSNRQCWSPWNMASFATNGSCLWLRSPVSFRLPSGGRIFVLELPIALMNWTCSLFQTLIFSLLKMLLALVFFLQCTAFLQFFPIFLAIPLVSLEFLSIWKICLFPGLFHWPILLCNSYFSICPRFTFCLGNLTHSHWFVCQLESKQESKSVFSVFYSYSSKKLTSSRKSSKLV